MNGRLKIAAFVFLALILGLASSLAQAETLASGTLSVDLPQGWIPRSFKLSTGRVKNFHVSSKDCKCGLNIEFVQAQGKNTALLRIERFTRCLELKLCELVADEGPEGLYHISYPSYDPHIKPYIDFFFSPVRNDIYLHVSLSRRKDKTVYKEEIRQALATLKSSDPLEQSLIDIVRPGFQAIYDGR